MLMTKSDEEKNGQNDGQRRGKSWQLKLGRIGMGQKSDKYESIFREI